LAECKGDGAGDGIKLLGSSGANVGPRQNREYKPFLAASRFAMVIIEVCGQVSVSEVDIPDAGVPDNGLLFEMMPVGVRLS
jgi:hypothetical protein